MIVDLTRTFSEEVTGFTSEPAKRLATDGWNARTLHLYSHSGTHMDAPRHFLPVGATIDNVDLGACLGPARCADLGTVAPDALIDVDALEAVAPWIEAGSRVLFRSGWATRHGTPAWRAQMPGFTGAAAKWLAARNPALIGVEPASVARVTVYPELREVHEILLGAGIVIVEGLINLDQLPTSKPFQLAALPLKIGGGDGDGAPARVVAWWDQPEAYG